MKLEFFCISARNPQGETQALNRFCAGRHIIHMDKEFVSMGNQSYWSVCVTWEGGGAGVGMKSRRRVDYKEVLNEQDFAVYVKLRDLRKEISEREGVLPFALFTNEQMALMVQNRVRTLAELGQIPGIGKARLEKYGAAFLQELCRAEDGNAKPNAALKE